MPSHSFSIRRQYMWQLKGGGGGGRTSRGECMVIIRARKRDIYTAVCLVLEVNMVVDIGSIGIRR